MFKTLIIFCITLICFNVEAFASQGHSEQYREYLNQPKPDWLSIGESIKVTALKKNPEEIFSKNGNDEELRVTRNTIRLPKKGITIEFKHSIRSWHSWDNPREKWLSPNGRMLVVNTGDYPRMYEILGHESYREIDFDFPKVTFDTQARGDLYGWRWADDGVLLAESAIENPETGAHESTRIYVYHVANKILARLNLESLNLGDLEGLEIVKIGSDANHIQFRIGDKLLTVEADLKTPPQLLTEPNRKNHSRINSSPIKRPSSTLPKASTDQPDSNNAKGDRWPMIVAGVLLLVLLALLFKVWKGKSA